MKMMHLDNVKEFFLENNEIHTYRGCQYKGGKSDICEITKAKAAANTQNPLNIDACEVCEEDGCNKSSHLYVKSGILLLALAILKAMV